jgi:hypothetical protein
VLGPSVSRETLVAYELSDGSPIDDVSDPHDDRIVDLVAVLGGSNLLQATPQIQRQVGAGVEAVAALQRGLRRQEPPVPIRTLGGLLRTAS